MRVLIFILFAFLSSCSSQESSDIFSSHSSNTPILVFGDSLSAHYNLSEESGWVYLFNKKLHEDGYFKHHQFVANYSKSGETTSGGLSRLQKALDETNPALIIIELGANDGLRRQSLSDMKSNLQEMIDMAKKRDIDIILIGVNLPSKFFFIPTREFTGVYKSLSKENDILFLENILKNVNSKNMLSDGLHPNKNGQVVMFENVYQFLRENY